MNIVETVAVTLGGGLFVGVILFLILPKWDKNIPPLPWYIGRARSRYHRVIRARNRALEELYQSNPVAVLLITQRDTFMMILATVMFLACFTIYFTLITRKELKEPLTIGARHLSDGQLPATFFAGAGFFFALTVLFFLKFHADQIKESAGSFEQNIARKLNES